MSFFKKPFIAVLLCIIVVSVSTPVSICVKLNNKCEKVIDTFYEGGIQNGFIVNSIYGNIVKMYELADSIVPIADNYGIKTAELSHSIADIKDKVNYKNPDVDEIYDSYTDFYNNLWAVELELSNIQLSQRHLEYMHSASEEVYNLKQAIDNSSYNDTVNAFYKKFEHFPVNVFADIFDVDYPEYFA